MADTRELQAELSAIAAKQAEINGKLRDMQPNRQKRFETNDRSARGPWEPSGRDERRVDPWRATGGGQCSLTLFHGDTSQQAYTCD